MALPVPQVADESLVNVSRQGRVRSRDLQLSGVGQAGHREKRRDRWRWGSFGGSWQRCAGSARGAMQRETHPVRPGPTVIGSFLWASSGQWITARNARKNSVTGEEMSEKRR